MIVRRGAVIFGLTASMTLGIIGPAVAQDVTPTTEDIVDAALVAVGQPTLEAPVASQDGLEVDPETLGASIELIPGAGVTVVPEDVGNSASRVTQNGVQVLTVLEEGSEARFDVDIPAGTRLVDTGAGGFDVVADGPEGPVELATITAPWAVDADGRELPSSYSLAGGQLVQTVDTRDATYPIVADPSIERKWYGFQVRFSKNETRTMAAGSGGVLVVAKYIPHPVVKGAVTAAAPAVAWWAGTALMFGKCIAINVAFVPVITQAWYWNC